jgi:hypothetical protein
MYLYAQVENREIPSGLYLYCTFTFQLDFQILNICCTFSTFKNKQYFFRFKKLPWQKSGENRPNEEIKK